MVTYAATLDVPRPVVDYLARLLAAHRRRIGTPKGSRVLGCFRQAVLVLRWFRERGCVHCLARNAGVSQATGYRYLHEGIDVLAGQAPKLHEVLTRCRRDGCSHVVLDGILIPTDRLASTTEAGNDWWYSGKHRTFGGNIQVLAAPDGTPLWTSDVEPGSVHDMAAARTHALPALYWAAAQLHLPTLADAPATTVPEPASTSRSPSPPAAPTTPSTPTTAPTTSSCAAYAPPANARPPNSPNAGAPSATSPSAPAASATSPAPQSSSTTVGNRNR